MTEELTRDEIERVEALLRMYEIGGDVTIWEDEFLADLEERYAEYGKRTRISPRQWEIIERLEEKYL